MAKSQEIIGIQHLRAAAATFVVLDHTSGMMALPKYFGESPFQGILKWGFTGVDLFFVISGFIIAFVSLRPQTLTAKISLPEYAERRFTRIYPFLWFAVAAYALLRLLGRGQFPADSYLRALFLIPGGDVDPNAVWTLRHEILFYAIFALVLMPSRLRFLPLIAWCVSPIIVGWSGASLLYDENILSTFFFSTVNILFGAGVLCGLLFLKAPHCFQWLKVHPLALLVLSAAPMVIGGLLNYDRTSLLHVSAMALICSILLGSALAAAESGTPSGWERIWKSIGDASYAIYLTHEGLISAFLGILTALKLGIGPQLSFILIILTVTITGYFIHVTIEQPLIQRTRQVFMKRRR